MDEVSNTGDTPSGKNSRRSSIQKKPNLRSVARLVKWTTSYAKWSPSGSNQGDTDSIVDGSIISEQRLTMRRGTIHDIARDMQQRRGSMKPARRSMGAIFNEKSQANSQLLSQAIREDIQKRKLLDKLRFFIRFRLLLHRWWKKHSVTEVSQTHPFYMQYRMINDLDLAETPADSAIDFKASWFKANKQMKMSTEAVRILTMRPEQRSDADVYYAMIALRGIDSIADYPIRMQKALAAHGMFQSFGPKRMVVRQGHRPDGYYFVLYGTVVVATLDSGDPYAKTRVTLRRGENFGELAIAHRIPRQSTVITMEYTEFLVIDCDTYENIFMAGGVKTIHDPDHNKFMQSLYFFKEWPLDKLQNNPKAMEFCYFRRNTVMVKDSNNSDWIYIVKSGSLRVFKKLKKNYSHVNKHTGNYDVRAHTDGFESFMRQKSEYKRYATYNNVDLPPPLAALSDSDDDCHSLTNGYGDEKENLLSLPLLQRVERLIRPRTAAGGVIATYGHSSMKRNIRSAKSEGSKSRRIYHGTELVLTPRTMSSLTSDDKAIEAVDDGQGKRTLLDDYEGSSRVKQFLFYLEESSINLEQHAESLCFRIDNGFQNYLMDFEDPLETSETKSKTNEVIRSSDVNANAITSRYNAFVTTMKKELTEADLDPEFVLVQTLTKGQAFGIQQLFIENQPSMTLVSGGVECVMVNKKFYKDNINPNTTQRLKQQLSPYPSDEDLQSSLQTRVNWMEYRKITLNNLVARQRDGKPSKNQTKEKREIFK